MYQHLLVLAESMTDGLILLKKLPNIVDITCVQVSVIHIAYDYAALSEVIDSNVHKQAAEMIHQQQLWLDQLAAQCTFPIKTELLMALEKVSSLKQYLMDNAVDLMIVGHTHHFFDQLTSQSMPLINHLPVDFLLVHLK